MKNQGQPPRNSGAPPLTRLAAVFVILGMAIGAAHGQSLPPVYTHENISFLSGGVGLEEAAAIKEAAVLFPLELVFVEKDKSGNPGYSAGNRVALSDAKGNTVLDTNSDGPYMLIKVPPGSYTVVAENQGSYRKQATTVKPGSHRRMVFVWQNVE